MDANRDAITDAAATSGGISAMAGRNSPWGGGSGGDDGGEPGNGTDREGQPTGDPEADDGGRTPEKEAGKDTSKDDGGKRGPRNPWLPSEDTPPRRSASIEDIFRNREARRTGQSGGPSGGRPGGFPNLPRRPDGSSWLPLAAGVVVAALVAMSSVHMLGPKEQGVVTRLGQYARTIDSGVNLTFPWPIEQVKVVDVSSFTVEAIPDDEKEKLMLTSDRSLVDLSYLVRWNIKDLKNYTFRLSDPEATVREVAEAAMRASIGQISLNDALSGAGRAQVEGDVRERMQRILDYYRAGILIQGVEIKKADPPAKTKAAFDQVQSASQEAERDRSQARALAQQLIARAQGDAVAFDKVYEQYKLAPEVTKRRMYYETMERVLRDNDAVIADAPGVTSYLPLPEVRRSAPPADTIVEAAPPAGGQ